VLAGIAISPIRAARFAEEDSDISGGSQLANAVGERLRAGGRLLELAVEIVKEPADRLRVCDLGATDGSVRASAHSPRPPLRRNPVLTIAPSAATN
jgi:hypothetical protein